MSNLATHLIPPEFFTRYGGKLVAGGQVQCSARGELDRFNQGLRTDGGWFSDNQLFFAEGLVENEDTPDYFYIDGDDLAPRPVRYFQLTPTDLGICAASLENFVEGIWNISSSRSSHYFPHTTAVGLQAIIREAFASVAKPDDSRITTSYGPEAESTLAFFRGRTWQRLDSDELTECEGLHFLTPDAWHYFLPAFLLAAAAAPNSRLAIDTMIHLQGFSQEKSDAPSEFHSVRWRCLSEQQVSVLTELFDWMNAVV